VKLRLITEITNENISYAKKMMEIGEVRHLKGVRSSFGIADGIQYLDHAISNRDQPSHAIVSNVKAIVEAKQYLFGTLWNISSSADQAVRNGARVKLLIPYGERTEIIAKDLKALSPEVDIRIADKSLETKITILIVDRKEVMTWELRDDSNENPYQAGGLATYSNNKSIASSYAIVDFNKLQREFINIAAHELRTPIQPILGLYQILQSKINNNNNNIEYQELLDPIVRNAKRLQQLTEDILDVAKIESQSLQLKKELLNVNEVILSVLADYDSSSSSSSSNNNIQKVQVSL
jgi:signal transduction histidine kinase